MGITLKALRINAGFTQKEAAKKLDVTPETLGSWERAETFPTVPQITKIEKLYGTAYADIIFLPNKFALIEK
jgi:putative transcriptional regulator